MLAHAAQHGQSVSGSSAINTALRAGVRDRLD
jgi:hypothetical protein